MAWWVWLIIGFMALGTLVDVVCLWFLLRTHYKHDGDSTI